VPFSRAEVWEGRADVGYEEREGCVALTAGFGVPGGDRGVFVAGGGEGVEPGRQVGAEG